MDEELIRLLDFALQQDGAIRLFAPKQKAAARSKKFPALFPHSKGVYAKLDQELFSTLFAEVRRRPRMVQVSPQGMEALLQQTPAAKRPALEERSSDFYRTSLLIVWKKLAQAGEKEALQAAFRLHFGESPPDEDPGSDDVPVGILDEDQSEEGFTNVQKTDKIKHDSQQKIIRIGRAVAETVEGVSPQRALELAGQRTDGRRTSESRRLKLAVLGEAIEIEKEWTLNDGDFDKKGGEHHVLFKDGRVHKWTGIELQEIDEIDGRIPYLHGSASRVELDASFPNGGFVVPAVYEDNTPLGYLSRIAWQNFLFDDDIRLESVTEDGRFHISQPMLRPGSRSEDIPNYLSEEAIEQWFFDQGWEIDYREGSVAHAVYYHPETGVYATDAHAGNFGWDADGNLKAFDLVVTPGKNLFPPSDSDDQPEVSHDSAASDESDLDAYKRSLANELALSWSEASSEEAKKRLSYFLHFVGAQTLEDPGAIVTFTGLKHKPLTPLFKGDPALVVKSGWVWPGPDNISLCLVKAEVTGKAEI